MANKTKIVNSAQKYLQRGAYDKAIRELQKLLEEDPRDVRTLLKIGDIYAKKGDRGEAIRVYRQVAEAYGEQGFFLKAVAVYKQILKHDPQHFEVTLKLAELYEHLGLMQEAMGQYQIVAGIHDQRGNTREWLSVLQRMVELDPENVASRVRLAEGLSREQMISQAIEQFTKAADLLKRQGRQGDYVKVAERLVFHDQSRLDVLKDLARIYLTQGDSKRAAAKLKTCFEQAPRDVETLTLLGRAFREVGHNGKAVYVYHQLAKVHAESGATHEARLVYQTILELDPNDVEARRALGMSGGSLAPAQPESTPWAEPQARPAPAAPPLQAEARTSPPRTSPPSRPSLRAGGNEQISKLLTETDVYVKYGLRDKALEHLRRILELDPSSIDAYLKMRDMYLAARDSSRAAEALAQAIRIYKERGEDARAEVLRVELIALAPGHPAARPGAVPRMSLDAFRPAHEAQEADLDSIEIEVSGDFDSGQAAAMQPRGIDEAQEDEPFESFEISAGPGASQPPFRPTTSSGISLDEDDGGLVLDPFDRGDRSSLAPEGQRTGDMNVPGRPTLDPFAGGLSEPGAAWSERSSADVGDVDIVESTDLPSLMAAQVEPAIGESWDDGSQPLLEAFEIEEKSAIEPDEDESGFGPVGTDVEGKKSLEYPMELATIETLNEDELQELTASQRSLSSFGGPAGSRDLAERGDEPFELDDPANPAAGDASGDMELLSILEGADEPLLSGDDEDDGDPELDEELESAEFLEQQGLHEEAREAVLEVLKRRPFYSAAVEMLDRLEVALGMREAAPAEAAAPAAGEDPFAGLEDEPVSSEEAPTELPAERPQLSDEPPALQAVDPADAARFLDTGYAYQQAGMYSEAIAAFETAAQVEEHAAEALEMIGHSLQALGDTLGAVSYFYRALEQGAVPERAPRLKYEIGLACEAAEDYENALAWYAAAYADDPQQPHLGDRIRNLGVDPDTLGAQAQSEAASTPGQNGAHASGRSAAEPRSQKKSKISYL